MATRCQNKTTRCQNIPKVNIPKWPNEAEHYDVKNHHKDIFFSMEKMVFLFKRKDGNHILYVH